MIFAYHGYPVADPPSRPTSATATAPTWHVRGYQEEGSTTTTFDMVVRNHLDRYHLVLDVIARVPKLGASAAYAAQEMRDTLIRHTRYVHEFGVDLPEVQDWQWPAPA